MVPGAGAPGATRAVPSSIDNKKKTARSRLLRQAKQNAKLYWYHVRHGKDMQPLRFMVAASVLAPVYVRLIMEAPAILPERFRPLDQAADSLEEEEYHHISGQTTEAAPLISHQAAETGKLMLAGGMSGAIAKTATAPMARLTILYQVQAVKLESGGNGMLQALRHVARTQGVTSLWRGNLATIIHRVPYSATNFATYELTSAYLEPRVRSDVLRRLTSGAAAGLVACTAAYPLDLLRTRLAAQTSEQQAYRGIQHAMQRILAEEGVRGLYKGLGATLLQVVPSLALNFTFYDTLKQMLLTATQQPAQQQLAQPHQSDSSSSSLTEDSSSSASARQSSSSSRGSSSSTSAWSNSPLLPLASGCGAALATSTITFPLDVVRRRLQVQGMHASTPAPAAAAIAAPSVAATAAAMAHQAQAGSLSCGGPQRVPGPSGGGATYLDVVRSILARQGPRGFYHGILAEYCKVIPGMAIAFTTYEAIKGVLGVEGKQ